MAHGQTLNLLGVRPDRAAGVGADEAAPEAGSLTTDRQPRRRPADARTGCAPASTRTGQLTEEGFRMCRAGGASRNVGPVLQADQSVPAEAFFVRVDAVEEQAE
jgi:hypothetical protein